MVTTAHAPFGTVRRFLVFEDRDGYGLACSLPVRGPSIGDTHEHRISQPPGTARIRVVEVMELDPAAALPEPTWEREPA